jgi:hypothetical protein
MTDAEIMKKAMSIMGKLSHKKSPRSRGYYKAMQAKSVARRKANKLSTGKSLHTAS